MRRLTVECLVVMSARNVEEGHERAGSGERLRY